MPKTKIFAVILVSLSFLIILLSTVHANHPYNSIAGGFWKGTDGKRYVMAYGIDIEGEIAAVEESK